MGSQQGMTMPGGANVGGLTAEQLRLISNINLDPAARSGLLGVAGQSAAFQPWSPTGASTLEQMLTTGAPTDVGALTIAAQTEGTRAFEDFLGGARERFGALNLESSSALEQAKMREASRLAQGIGETGLRAGVGAAEAATGRRAGALDPALAGAGQRLAGLGQAGGIYGQLGGLDLQAAISKAGAGQGMLGTFAQPAMGIAQTPMTAPQATGPQAAGPLEGMRTIGPGARRGSQNIRRPSTGGAAPRVARTYAQGGAVGRVPERLRQGAPQPKSLSFNPSGQRADLGDYLSQLVFGQTFNRPAPPVYQPSPVYQQQLPAAYRPPPPPMYPPPVRQYKGKGRADMSRARSDNDLALLGEHLTRPVYGGGPAFQSPQHAAAWLRFMGPQNIAGLVQSSWNAQVGRAHGGEVPGVDTGEDYVPAMLRGGELVLTPEVADEVRQSDSDDPLVQRIQQFLDKEPEYTDDGAQFQFGGPTQFTGPVSQGTQDIYRPGISMTNAPIPSRAGTFSIMGTPPEQLTPEAKAQRDYESASRLASLIRSAMILGTQGSAESLATSGIPGLAIKGLEGAEKRVSEERQLSEARKEGEAQRAAVTTQAEAERKAKEAAQAKLVEAQNIQQVMQLAGQLSVNQPIEQAVNAALSMAQRLGIQIKNPIKAKAYIMSPERKAEIMSIMSVYKAQQEANAKEQLRSRLPTEGLESALKAWREWRPLESMPGGFIP